MLPLVLFRIPCPASPFSVSPSTTLSSLSLDNSGPHLAVCAAPPHQSCQFTCLDCCILCPVSKTHCNYHSCISKGSCNTACVKNPPLPKCFFSAWFLEENATFPKADIVLTLDVQSSERRMHVRKKGSCSNMASSTTFAFILSIFTTKCVLLKAPPGSDWTACDSSWNIMRARPSHVIHLFHQTHLALALSVGECLFNAKQIRKVHKEGSQRRWPKTKFSVFYEILLIMISNWQLGSSWGTSGGVERVKIDSVLWLSLFVLFTVFTFYLNMWLNFMWNCF